MTDSETSTPYRPTQQELNAQEAKRNYSTRKLQYTCILTEKSTRNAHTILSLPIQFGERGVKWHLKRQFNFIKVYPTREVIWKTCLIIRPNRYIWGFSWLSSWNSSYALSPWWTPIEIFQGETFRILRTKSRTGKRLTVCAPVFFSKPTYSFKS